MRVKLCCFTCLICEDSDEKSGNEDKPLINEEDQEVASPVNKQPITRNLSSPSPSTSDISAEHEASISGKEKLSKAVGVLKRYNVVSKRYSNSKEIQRQLSSPLVLRIKIAVKVMPKSDLVKIFMVEATNVMSVLHARNYPETGSSSEGESAPVMQIRSKILPQDIRGHTRKYEINDSITGSMKFRNECIHSMKIQDFVTSSLRLRVYYVLKHQRDKLLGEYTIQFSETKISLETGTTHVTMETYDPMNLGPDHEIPPPEIVAVNQHLFSFDSQSSITSPTSNPKIIRQKAVQSQDSTHGKKFQGSDVSSVDEAADVFSEDEDKKNRPFAKAFKSIRHGATSILKDSTKKEKIQTSRSTSQETDSASNENVSFTDKLQMALSERGEGVDKLEQSTTLMENSAEQFSDIAEKLRQKYQSSTSKSLTEK